MFDVFYIGDQKPGVFPHERGVNSIQEACDLSRTRYFWIINYLSDYTGWDWLWEPSPWQSHQRHAWPSQWQKDSGTYLIPKSGFTDTNYHAAPVITRKADASIWLNTQAVTGFDYSWHPDPAEADYEYHFGTQWQPAGGPVYPGRSGIKLVDDQRAQHRASPVNWLVPQGITGVDYTWHPNPLDPPYIYHFPDQHQPISGVTYTVPGAREIKLVDAFCVRSTRQDPDHWSAPDGITGVDYTWHPNPLDPPYIYHFPDQHQPVSGVTYTVPGAQEVKFVDAFQVTTTRTDRSAWSVPDGITGVDYTWHPNPIDPPYIYHFPDQHQPISGVTYTVPGAQEIKLVNAFQVTAHAKTAQAWYCPDYIDAESVDYTWHPNPIDPPYIYHFPSQHQPVSGVTYTVPGAQEIKILESPQVRALSQPLKWTRPDNIVGFDYSWHPNPLDPPYTHEFGTQWYNEGGPVYHMPGAESRKYHESPRATLSASQENWHRLYDIDDASFDWSWRPHPRDPAYIYVWGNQHWPAEKMPTIEYRVPGATERKYMSGGPRLKPCYENWVTPDDINEDTVDYTWRPDPGDPAYIYEFATQWQKTGGACYVVPGATERKFTGIPHQRRPQQDHHWQVLANITDFDFSWHPDSTEEPYIYVFGNQHYPGTVMPTVRYCVAGATQEKFVDSPRAQLAESRDNWEILEPIAESEWDWSWVPNPRDPPYIYVWGNQWNPAEYKASVRYLVPGATEVKYMSERTRRLADPSRFRFNLAVADFDYSWEPNPFDPPMTYVFGNQWNPAVLEPTVIYDTGGTEIKYMDSPVARVAQDVTAWTVLDDIEDFDYSWRPNPTDPPYIYVFGNQWLQPEQRPALEYRVPGATERKYMSEPRARRVSRPEDFVTHWACDFDWTWEPDPGSPPYIYVWGNQWWPAEIMPTVEYRVPGATERKYMSEPQASLRATDQYWQVTTDHAFEFDRSWQPDPGSPPYIYVFGNQWWPAEQMSTIEYHQPGATERKFMSEPAAKILPDRSRWSVPEEVDADTIDYSWIPDPQEPAYIYHFGTDYQISVGLTYTVPGATDLKFAGAPPQLVQVQDKPVVKTLDIFYMDRSNAMSRARFERLRERYPDIQKVRYVNSVMDTIARCANKTRSMRFWVIGSENDYTDFDFAWHAEPWQSSMTHVFGSQWNKWSDTFLINRWEFERHAKWASGIEEFPNLNFVGDQRVTAPADASDIYMIDFGNAEAEQTLAFLSSRYRVVRTARYFDNYLDTLRRLIKDVEAEHIWVVGSVCDYSRFDFSWQPEAWQRDMLHVFPSAEQKFGDTFYVPVQILREKIHELELLDWFDTVNYCEDQRVPRWPMPVIQHDQDTHVDVVLDSTFSGPLALFANRTVVQRDLPTVSLWREKTKTIVPLDSGAGAVIVPRNAIGHIRTQFYDYAYINREHRNLLKDRPLDVVFIANGEPNAEQNWKSLQQTLPAGRRPHRVDGVNGRVAAYHAAAQASTTPWFFAVFAKLEVNPEFDWAWQPDRMQQPKHYIFHARNPVNGLVYGHQAMIAYNRELVLANPGRGLDFTLDSAHEVVPMLSGVARYNTDAWTAWRTAFRETIKLRASLPDVENEYRLDQWITKGQGPYGEWSVYGAEDAMAYYDEVAGDFDQLRRSYEWSWLATYVFMKRNLTPGR